MEFSDGHKEQHDSLSDLPSTSPSPSSAMTPLSTTTTADPPPPPRGRPRSSSISNGSPSPVPGSIIPLPLLFHDPHAPPPAYSNSWPHRSPSGAPATLLTSTSTRSSGSTPSAALGLALGSGGSIGPSGISNSSTSSSSTSSFGWGHKSSLSVPGTGIIAPVPQSLGPGKVGRHRRTQSVSPPGFPNLGATLADDPLAARGASGAREDAFAAAMTMPIAMPSVPSRSSPSGSAAKSLQDTPPSLSSPFSFGSTPSSTSSSSGSPQSFPFHSTHHSHAHAHSHSHSHTHSLSHSLSHSHSHVHSHHSHSALLSGIRSHALPHSPTLEAYDARGRPRSPVLSTSPQSPPFGPTTTGSPVSHAPSPLSLSEREDDDDEAEGQDGKRAPAASAGLGMQVDPSFFNGRAPSPPLLPLPPAAKSLSPPTTYGSPSATASPPGRPRRTSIGHLSPPSPVSLFLEKDDRRASQGQVDMRKNLEEKIRVSPPPSPTFFSSQSASPDEPYPNTLREVLPPPSSVPPSPLHSTASTYSRVKDFQPALVSTTPTPRHELLPSSTSPLAPESPPSPALAGHIISSEELLLVPPASPHRSPISLPLPIVAPAPLPPHLGGPPLHSSLAPRSKSKGARARSKQRNALASSGEMLHVPKKHSPLASPALSSEDEEEDSDEEEEEEEEEEEADGADTRGLNNPKAGPSLRSGQDGQDSEAVARALEDARSTEMDRDIVPLSNFAASPMSPVGQDEHHENSAYPGSIQIPLPPAESSAASAFPPRPPLRLGSVSPPPLPITELDKPQFGALGFMDIDPTTALAPEGGLRDLPASREAVALEEASLSPLERIFVCAKSDSTEDRARVAHNLASWLGAVDIAEAVEYVLPLLAGLATDYEEIVKEVFAPQLDRIMWHFFSQCQLTELDLPPDGEPEHGDAIPSRFMSAVEDGADEVPPSTDSPTSSLFTTTESTSSVPTTTKTSPANTDNSPDLPRITVTTFTSLLGALLTDQSAVVAHSTQSALVRFICRIKGKAGPPPSPIESSVGDFSSFLDAPLVNRDSCDDTSSSTFASIGADACMLLEDEFLNGIVLGLARLDDEDGTCSDVDVDVIVDADGGEKTELDEYQAKSEERRRSRSSSRTAERTPPAPTLFMSPEEDIIDDDWVGSGVEGDLDDVPIIDPMAASWGEPLTAYANGSRARANSENRNAAEPVHSTFSADGQGDEESSIGKMVSMSLIAAIATAGCLEPAVLAGLVLPEVDRMKSEQMFYVRKEAVYALGNLASTLPVEVFELSVLPLYATFAQDNLWHVRRAASVALPSICRRLAPHLRRATAVLHTKAFATDSALQVRHGALETCGELIHLFLGDPDGVPADLLAFYLGTPFADAPPPPETPFAPLTNALDNSPPRTFFDDASPWTSSPRSKARDPDRLVMCAFNLPAVALTLGFEKWSLLQDFYESLTTESVSKVRQSLAASMHEIAKIIGPLKADECLLAPLANYLRDLDAIQGAVMENLTTLFGLFTPAGSRRALEVVYEVWSEVKTWRRREQLADALSALAPHYVALGVTENYLRLLARAFKDPVASVRQRAVAIIPIVLASTANDPSSRAQLFAFLAVFASDSSARNRTTYTASVSAIVVGGLDRTNFESQVLDSLLRLARDRVVSVRIGVARAVAAACQSASLYVQPESRSVLSELLHLLISSPDRDVAAPVLGYSNLPHGVLPSSPPPGQLDRAGAQSRMGMYDDVETIFPRRLQAAGPLDYEMSDVPLEEAEPRLRAGDMPMMSGIQGEGEGEEVQEEAGGDVEMGDAEGEALFRAQNLDGDDFVEVYRPI